MHKHILVAAFTASIIGNSALAGGLAPAIQEEVIVIEEGPVASSGAQYVVGLILLGLIVAANSSSSTEAPAEQ